jgi:hypothetical protein
MASRLDSPAPDVDRCKAMGGRGREGEPIEWTGWAWLWKLETEANPGLVSVTLPPSVRKHAEVIGPHAAKKSL